MLSALGERERFVLGALAAGAVVEVLCASPSIAAAAGLDPSFSASDIHYRLDHTTGSSFGISSVTFTLRASDPTDVIAWFNSDAPPPAQIYDCSPIGSVWTCTEAPGAVEQGLKGATSLHVRVNGVSSQSSGGAPTAGGGGTTSSGGSSGGVSTSPGSGGSGGGSSAGSPPGVTTAPAGSVSHAPTIFGATLPFTGLMVTRLLVYALAACVGGFGLTRWGRRRQA